VGGVELAGSIQQVPGQPLLPSPGGVNKQTCQLVSKRNPEGIYELMVSPFPPAILALYVSVPTKFLNTRSVEPCRRVARWSRGDPMAPPTPGAPPAPFQVQLVYPQMISNIQNQLNSAFVQLSKGRFIAEAGGLAARGPLSPLSAPPGPPPPARPPRLRGPRRPSCLRPGLSRGSFTGRPLGPRRCCCSCTGS